MLSLWCFPQFSLLLRNQKTNKQNKKKRPSLEFGDTMCLTFTKLYCKALKSHKHKMSYIFHSKIKPSGGRAETHTHTHTHTFLRKSFCCSNRCKQNQREITAKIIKNNALSAPEKSCRWDEHTDSVALLLNAD